MSDWIDELFIHIENGGEPCTMSQVSLIESLLVYANIDEREKDTYVGLDKLTFMEANNLIRYLARNQINKVKNGNCNMTEIYVELNRIRNEEREQTKTSKR